MSIRLSRYPFPTRKESVAEATLISHNLMVRAGLIHQEVSGIYSWLPLGHIVLKKIEKIVREEQERSGAHEVLLPTVQPSSLWKKSGRYNSYGQEMLHFKDRRGCEMIYAPTSEEMMTVLARYCIRSYRDLPRMFYQIQWKFRDEIRPRFGVMRSREFYMKDCYSFDLDAKEAINSYNRMILTYLRTFARMGVVALPVKASTGAIGGIFSQEFHIVAKTGESSIYYSDELDYLVRSQEYSNSFVDQLKLTYAVESSLHNSLLCPIAEQKLKKSKSIEVGHIFSLGTKYSEIFNTSFINKDGKQTLVQMNSYGIGLSRLVGAIIETNHDEDGIVFPFNVAPFEIGIILTEPDNLISQKTLDGIELCFKSSGIDTICDDRKEHPGVKFATMDLIGIPWQIRLRPKPAMKTGVGIEVKCRRTGKIEEMSIESSISYLTELCLSKCSS